MAHLVLGFGLLADGACLALLIGLSGFVFEGPEGAQGDAAAVTLWLVGVAVTLLSAVGAILLARRRRIERAALLSLVPVALGLLLAAGVGELIVPP